MAQNYEQINTNQICIFITLNFPIFCTTCPELHQASYNTISVKIPMERLEVQPQILPVGELEYLTCPQCLWRYGYKIFVHIQHFS